MHIPGLDWAAGRGAGSLAPSSVRVRFTRRFVAVLALIALFQLLLATAMADGLEVPVTIAILAVFVLASVIEPRVAFIVPMLYILYSPVEGSGLGPADAILLLGPVIVGISALMGGDIARRAGAFVAAHGFKLLVILFGVLVFIAFMKARVNGVAEGAIQPARMALYPLALFGLAVFRDRREILRALRFCFYVATVYLFLAALYYLASGGTATRASVSTGGERVVGNSSAMYLAMAFVLLALHLGQENRLLQRIGLSCLMLMASIGIILALSRATWAASIVVVPVLFALSPTFRNGLLRFIATAAPVVLIMAMLAPVVAADQLDEIRARVATPEGPVQRDQSAETRLKSWSLMTDVWRESPVLGSGFGQSVSFIGNNEKVKVVVNDPHNGYLFILVSMGLVGLGVYVLIHLGFLGMAARAVRGPPISREIGIWAIAAWFIFMVNVFLGVLLTITTFGIFLWTLLSLPVALAVLPERAGEEDPLPADPAPEPTRHRVPVAG